MVEYATYAVPFVDGHVGEEPQGHTHDVCPTLQGALHDIQHHVYRL